VIPIKTYEIEVMGRALNASATITVEAESLEEAKEMILSGVFDVEVDTEATVGKYYRAEIADELTEDHMTEDTEDNRAE
jgi:hypothetical protein